MHNAFLHVLLEGIYLQAPCIHLVIKLGFVLLVGSLSLILLFDEDLRRCNLCVETKLYNQDVARHRYCEGS